MDPQEIRTIVAAVLAEQQGQLDAVAHKAVTDVLFALGIDENDHREMRADLQHLRKWRRSVEQAQSLTFRTVIGTLVAGGLAALWLGIRDHVVR